MEVAVESGSSCAPNVGGWIIQRQRLANRAKIAAGVEQPMEPSHIPHPVIAAAFLLVSVVPCLGDDVDSANKPRPTAYALCGNDGAKLPGCKDGSFDRLGQEVDAAIKAALAEAPPMTAPILMRDQFSFREMIGAVIDDATAGDDDQLEGQKRALDNVVATLQQRIATLHAIAQGFGRTGVAGRWANAFGTVEIAPVENHRYRIVLSGKASYGGSADSLQQICNADAAVYLGADGWLSGKVAANQDTTGAQAPALEAAVLKIRRQADSLRVVAADEVLNKDNDADFNCRGVNQLTGNFFAIGTTPAANGQPGPFVAPTFDCAHPATESDEEICADPDLAANDLRLNQAWKRLLPRLDAATRRLLTEDQRAWAKSQAERYSSMLHPAWAKQTNFVHWTALAHGNLAQLQRERIAMLEGYDENRRGYEGGWRGYNATLSVTRQKNGKLNADGNKWFEGDYKGGCDYEFKGTVDGDVFHPDDKSKNPDTMERDHGTLIVNRTDDVWAKRRPNSDSIDPDVD